MTEEDIDRLMEFLGEYGELEPCERCSPTHYELKKRSFTTWQDLGDLKEKMVKKGNWEGFIFYCKEHQYPLDDYDVYNFTSWLLNPARFCQLVADFLKERKP